MTGDESIVNGLVRRRTLAKSGPALLAVFFAGWLTGCVSADPALFPPKPAAAHIPIYVISHGWHTGLAVEVKQIPSGLVPEVEDLSQHRYLEIGWGERDFYMASGSSLWLGIKAMLWPNDAVMHLVGFDKDPVRYFPRARIARIELSRAGILALSQYIDDSFDREGKERATAIGAGLYGHSLFYPAHGVFFALNVCNKWTAHALRAAGAPISTFYAFTADNVMGQCADFGTLVSQELGD